MALSSELAAQLEEVQAQANLLNEKIIQVQEQAETHIAALVSLTETAQALEFDALPQMNVVAEEVQETLRDDVQTIDPSEFDDVSDQIMSALGSLASALSDFNGLEDDLDLASGTVTERVQFSMDEVANFAEIAKGELISDFVDCCDNEFERLEDEIFGATADQLEDIGSQLNTNLEEMTDRAFALVRGSYDQIGQAFGASVTQLEDEIVSEVAESGKLVISGIIGEVTELIVEDMALSQAATSLSMALQSYTPMIAAAYGATEAYVKLKELSGI